MRFRRLRRALLIAGGALFAFSVAADCPLPHVDEQAVVAYVYDGDTVRLHDGRRIRLLGVNAPEVAHEERPGQAYGEEATRELRRLLPEGTAVRLSYDSERRDKYGRELAHLARSDGTNVQAALLARGAALVLVIPPNVALADCYARIEAAARHAARGLWSRADFRPAGSAAPGWRILESRVARGGNSRFGLWFKLDAGVTVYVDTPDLAYFEPQLAARIAGQRVRVRGWVRDSPRGLTMRVRHPTAMEVLQ